MDLRTKKGFLFVITVFLILTYILLSISMWVKAIEASERAYSELYKESTVELIIDQLTPAKIGNISEVAMTRGVFAVNRHSIDHPLKEGSEEQGEYYYIENAMGEYLVNGTPAGENFYDGIAPESEYNASLGGWVANLNASLLAIGAYIDDFEIYEFGFGQSDINTLNYSFSMRISLKDTSGTTSISRTYDVDGEIDITGFVDPAIARETKKMHEPVYRQFFFNTEDYPDTAAVSPGTPFKNIDAGQGWFYGPMIAASGALRLDEDHRHRYIVVGDYDSVTGLGDEMKDFGAIILTNAPDETEDCIDTSGIPKGGDESNTFNALKYEGPDCDAGIDYETITYIPFAVVPGFNMDGGAVPTCPDLVSGTDEKCVLFIAEHDPTYVLDGHFESKKDTPAYTGLYNMEEMRDFILCGYYVLNDNSPSYLQRLLNDSYSRSSELGIETFLVGEYVAPPVYEKYDRLDREMMNGTLMEEFIRGTPGCKDIGMCDSSDTITGRFGLSTNTIDEYGADNVDCGEGAGCK